MSKGTSSKAALVLMLIGACGVAALAWYVKADPQAARVPADLRRSETPSPDVEIARPKPAPDEGSSAKTPRSVMVPTFERGKLGAEMTSIPVPDGQDPKAFLVDQIAKGTQISALVLGVDVRNGVAVVNFGKGIDDGMGSDQEALFITALQKGFAQFPDVQKLELDKENQPLDSLGGHIDLTDGLPVTPAASRSSDPKPSAP